MSLRPFITPALLLAIAVGGPADAGRTFGPRATATELASVPSAEKGAPTGALGRSRNAGVEEATLVFDCTASLLQGDLNAAEQFCARAEVLKPSDAAPHKLIGVARLLEKRYAGARDEFAQAVRLAPRDASNRVGLAEALRGQGDFGGSIRAFTVALKLAPRDAGIWNARCWTRGLFGKQLRAGLGDCNTALALWSANASFLDSRGLIYLRLGDARSAIRNYDRALAITSNLPTAVYGRGVSKLRLGHLQDGVTDITLARSLDVKIDDVFAEAPLLSRACRTALFTSSARAACTGRQGSPKAKPPIAARSFTMKVRPWRAALAFARPQHRPYTDEKAWGR